MPTRPLSASLHCSALLALRAVLASSGCEDGATVLLLPLPDPAFAGSVSNEPPAGSGRSAVPAQ